MRRGAVTLLAFLSLLIAGVVVQPGGGPVDVGPIAGTGCTDGVDCYCDGVSDPNLLLCEDFEAATLHDDTGLGDQTNAGGENIHGSWYDNTGYPSYPFCRACNSYWNEAYVGFPVGKCLYSEGEPSSPTLGSACSTGTGQDCGPLEWDASDRWDANSLEPCIDIVRNGEFDAEVATLSDPQVPGAHSGVFDGNQSFRHRIGAGLGNTAGILGEAQFGGSFTEIGATMAMAYSSNAASTNIWSASWKHDEWRTGNVACGANPCAGGPWVFHNTGSLAESDPFNRLLYFIDSAQRGGDPATVCVNAISDPNVNETLGTLSCADVAMYVRADAGAYTRSTDWPFGEWGCIRMHLQNLGSTTNTKIEIWFNDTKVIDISGLDGSFLANAGGYSGLKWNAFSNANQPGGEGTTAVTYRDQDNVHITNGPPVSCQAIGFP